LIKIISNASLFLTYIYAFMDKNSVIYIAGHRGMVGGAILRRLQTLGYQKLLTASSADLDLRNPDAVNKFFSTSKPEYVFLAAAKVGGIKILQF